MSKYLWTCDHLTLTPVVPGGSFSAVFTNESRWNVIYGDQSFILLQGLGDEGQAMLAMNFVEAFLCNANSVTLDLQATWSMVIDDVFGGHR